MTEFAKTTSFVTAPLAGVVARVLVAEGDLVLSGQAMCVLETLKLETSVVAPCAGRVANVFVAPDMTVRGGQELFVLA